MGYCDQTDVTRRIGSTLLIELTDDTGAGTVETTALAECISDSDGVINGYLRGRYSVPLSTVPDLIKRISTYLTIYYLYDRRASAFGGIPPHIAENYKFAIDTLKLINNGTVDLGIEPPPASSTAQIAQTDGPTRGFTATTMMDF